MKPTSETATWSAKVRDRESPERDAFLQSHIELVKYLALRLSARLPACVEVDDLINDGILGLLDAADKYDPSRGVRFRTYAEARVRGAILDGLRQKDWRPRSVRHLQRQIDSAMGELSSKHRRPATEDEIAGCLGIDVPAYRSILQDMNVGPLLSLDEIGSAVDSSMTDDSNPPHALLEHKDLLRALAEEIQRLPEREKHVLELYYQRGLNMKEVGAVLGITESRVCQLHSQAAARLRVTLRARMRPSKNVPVLAGKR